jgi:hypothetical protein
MIGDMGELFNAMRDDRRDRRARLGVDCPQCAVSRPKAFASILLPGQRCKVDGYRDPRLRDIEGVSP